MKARKEENRKKYNHDIKHTYKIRAGILGGVGYQGQNGLNEKHWASRDE